MLDSEEQAVTKARALPKFDGPNQASFHREHDFPLSVSAPVWFPKRGTPKKIVLAGILTARDDLISITHCGVQRTVKVHLATQLNIRQGRHRLSGRKLCGARERTVDAFRVPQD